MRADPAPADPLRLASARVHETEGAGRHAFALFQVARHPGPLVWVLPAYGSEQPFLPGLPKGVGERLHVVRARSETDLLWATEEALRAAPVGFVIAEPGSPLSLTAGRRLQLAAEAGGTTGLLLIRTGMGSNAAETRWQCAPQPAATGRLDSPPLDPIKNKKATIGGWTLHWDGTSAAFDLVSATGERRGPAATSSRGAVRPDPAHRVRIGNADHLHCLNSAAEKHDLRRGMALADARAICSGLATRPADLAREAAMLAALGRWTGRYAPMVGRDGADGLMADITGVAHLFGGEADLRADLHAGLERAGFTAD